MIVRERVMDTKSVALDIFEVPLYSKILHVVLALSDEYPNDNYKVSNSGKLLHIVLRKFDAFVRYIGNPYA